MDTTQQSLVRISQNAAKIPLDSKMPDPNSKRNQCDMSASDKNKHQWNEDVANLSTSITYNLWNKQPDCLNTHDFRKLEASNILPDTKVDFPIGKSNPESTEKLSSPNTINNNRMGNVPALTPMAFGSGQDSHLSKQEENRRQWKAALDEQLKEQQLMRGKNPQELQKECGFNKIHSGSSSSNRGHCDNSTAFHELSTSNNQFNSALASHPSASHFMSSGFFLPDSTVTNSFQPSPGKKDNLNQPWKVGFNRVRGFTQQLYTDSLESAERARLAHETRLINLKQIEEKRRLKEEEKARLLMEEKMEEERISRERLRLQQMAEVENARKIAKDMEEFQRTQYLYESLVRAQEEAKLSKIQKHPCHSELKRNRDSLSQQSVIQSELLAPYWSVASVVEKQSQINPLYAFLSSSGCNASDYVVYPKNSFAVQTSFPENIGIQTVNNKTKVSQLLKGKQTSKSQSFNSDSYNNNDDFSKSANERSKLSSSNSAQTINSCTGTNKFERSVQDGSSTKSRIPIPISTAYSISSTSMPKNQVSTVNTESPNNTTFLNNENPYGPVDLIRTYDVLIPNDGNIILPVGYEPGAVENTRKSEGKDSLRNPNTKHERSITRQDTILQQLSEIRKFIQSQIREINTILSRHLRVYSLLSCVIWLLLIGAFLRTTWNVSYLIVNQSSYGNNANLNKYDDHWKPTIHTVSRLTDAMLNLWPVYIAKHILPSSDITLITFSSQSPFPFASQLNSVMEFDKREQYRVFLTNAFHGLITRLIWIYPSWKQSSVNQFYKKSQFHVGLAQINLVEDDDDNNKNNTATTNSNTGLDANFPSRITTFCLCNPAENFCSLPLLPSSTIHIPRQSCSVANSFIYEEMVDLMAESILSQGGNERSTKDLIYLFSLESYFQSDKSTLSKKSSSPPSHTSSFHNKRTVWIDNLFILHIDMNYFIESITTVNKTPSDLSSWFIDYLRINSLNDSSVNFSTIEPLLKNDYPSSHKNANHIVDNKDNNNNGNHIPTVPALIIHQPSIELLSLNLNENINVFNQWKDKYRIAFYYLDNYCSHSDAMIDVLLNKPTIMVGAKKELSRLWSWLCKLNAVTLKFISQFVVCTYQNGNHIQSIGLCNREKSSLISFDEMPKVQRSPFTLYTLQSIITYLPRPLSVNLVMHPSWEQIIHQMHLSTELCNMLNEYILNKQDNHLSRGKNKK
ncbi:hypothetical protein Smp_160220.1 [Schistosoma mansoni]|uniref:hypothetical protein n=1 Tax=Schistosoma mansoni TaxID=6183 RepID=UPI0001A625F6|nr:hypothetical protein Smp_160220.1 [Schistosoma mansoni]|eukprot:XP_018652122.1 hypothetical protein Smp_160220.1 [Schistosoma mansoni]